MKACNRVNNIFPGVGWAGGEGGGEYDGESLQRDSRAVLDGRKLSLDRFRQELVSLNDFKARACVLTPSAYHRVAAFTCDI